MTDKTTMGIWVVWDNYQLNFDEVQEAATQLMHFVKVLTTYENWQKPLEQVLSQA